MFHFSKAYRTALGHMQSPIQRAVPSGQSGHGVKLAIPLHLLLKLRKGLATLPTHAPLPYIFMVHKVKTSSLPFSNNSFG